MAVLGARTSPPTPPPPQAGPPKAELGQQGPLVGQPQQPSTKASGTKTAFTSESVGGSQVEAAEQPPSVQLVLNLPTKLVAGREPLVDEMQKLKRMLDDQWKATGELCRRLGPSTETSPTLILLDAGPSLKDAELTLIMPAIRDVFLTSFLRTPGRPLGLYRNREKSGSVNSVEPVVELATRSAAELRSVQDTIERIGFDAGDHDPILGIKSAIDEIILKADKAARKRIIHIMLRPKLPMPRRSGGMR